MQMPPLRSARLLVRPFCLEDLEEVLSLESALEGTSVSPELREHKRRWLQWSSETPEQFAAMFQPPYGDRAVVDVESGRLIGAAGLVPAMGPFAQLWTAKAARMTPEVGLYYAIHPERQGQGLATEAAGLLLEYGRDVLKLQRMIATTSVDNFASQRVMTKCGMTLHKNLLSEPTWFQLVGILDWSTD